jgi:hypothetical protein
MWNIIIQYYKYITYANPWPFTRQTAGRGNLQLHLTDKVLAGRSNYEIAIGNINTKLVMFVLGVRGGVVIKVLCYKPGIRDQMW